MWLISGELIHCFPLSMSIRHFVWKFIEEIIFISMVFHLVLTNVEAVLIEIDKGAQQMGAKLIEYPA